MCTLLFIMDHGDEVLHIVLLVIKYIVLLAVENIFFNALHQNSGGIKKENILDKSVRIASICLKTVQ